MAVAALMVVVVAVAVVVVVVVADTGVQRITDHDASDPGVLHYNAT